MLDDYRAAIELLVAEELGAYTARLGTEYEDRIALAKEINDPVWGTLTLGPLEVLLVDSPTFQRLRRVKQLGVAHWVYPAATHTRLEHSIGALFLVQRLLAAAQIGGEAVPAHYGHAIRLAALCHDIGHGVMSHVSENALAYVEATEQLRNEFTEVEKREAQLGEINSFLIVGTPAFKELLTAAQIAARQMIEIDDLAGFLQKCIIGRPVDPEYPLLHQLVSGPFDADKLDYMNRDAYMSGVPVVTDVNRLVRKVRNVRIPRKDAPLAVQRLSTTDTNDVVVVGIDRSGDRTLDELTLGRTLLFDKLYRHHKTRACELMVTAMLVRIARAAVSAGQEVEAVCSTLRLDDDALMTGQYRELLQQFSLDDESSNVVAHVANLLRERRLFVRAISFSRKMTNDSYDQDDEQSRALQELLAEIDDPIRRRAVGDRIAELAQSALEILGVGEVTRDWPGTLSDYVWLDGLRNPEHLAAPTKAMLIGTDGEVIPYAAEAPETPQWATAYQQTRDTAFVFCPAEIALPTAFAAERVLREEFGVRLPGGALVATRHVKEKGRAERIALTDGGFYQSSPTDLLPLPEPLRRGDVESLMDQIAGQLHGYCPPLVGPERAGRDRFEAGRIRDFVRQFQDDDLIESAIEILRSIEMIDRQAVVAPLLSYLERHPEFQEASLVVFGSAGDSSSVVTYFGMDAGSRFPSIRPMDLGDALIEGKPILFVDDLIGTGRQAEAIVRAWFGDMSVANELGEQRRELPAEAQTLLKRTSIGFCFAAGLSTGPQNLERTLSEMGITAVEISVGLEEGSLPTVFASGSVEQSKRDVFIQRCSKVGDALLAEQPEEKRADRTLGYGNKGLLITFPYNTPSQTLTCLWERGNVDGKPWTPLLPRRRKS